MRLVYLLFVVLLFSGTSWPPAKQRVGEATYRPGKDYALFFAVDNYAVMNDLQNPIRNARDIAAVLSHQYGFETEVVQNPTYEEIEQKLASYQSDFQRGVKARDGQLFLFFTGHGLEDNDHGYFVPSDGDPGRAHRTAIPYGWLRGEIDAIDCNHILVMVDACHSATFNPAWQTKSNGRFNRPGEQFVDQTLQNFSQHRARLFITSDAVGEQTPDRSALARQLLEGLTSYRSNTNYLTSSILASNYLEKANPIPGGGEFGSDRSAGASCFLFFRTEMEVTDNTRTDLADWQAAEAQDDCAGYKAYLQKHPFGDFVSIAKEEIVPCEEEERMIAAWQRAKELNDCDTYDQFKVDFPDSPYTILVDKLKKDLACTPPPPPPPPLAEEEIFKIVERMPLFPGCSTSLTYDDRKQCAGEKFYEFIYSNIKYPAIAKDNGVEGMVVISFVVERDGTLSGIRILRNPGAGLGDEALRIVESMNTSGIRWAPGQQRGRAVRVQVNYPIRFRIP